MLVLIPLGAFLIVRAISRLRELIQKTQLVVVNIEDATGDDKLKATLPGLSQRFRERMYYATLEYEKEMQKERASANPNELSKAPPPSPDADVGITDLITALKGAAPDQAKLVLTLLAALFPPKGRRVGSTLLLVGTPPRRLGLLAQIVDMAKQAESQLHSLYGATPANPEQPPAGSEPHQRDKAKAGVAEGLVASARSLERAGRWEDAVAKFQAAVEASPEYPSALSGLERTLGRASPRQRAEEFLELAAQWLALWLLLDNLLAAYE
ncbi:MAG: hypothetical protein M3T56_09345 [Chloroflexota bacterium]|nr:hypothetical protein [Chloroflexota bacterium]